jgi:acyl-coenzyme A synthetase/AMP-(fatty) acid ligase
MTEFGMGLSNKYDGVRVCGSIGIPLPGVEAIVVDDDNNIIT